MRVKSFQIFNVLAIVMVLLSVFIYNEFSNIRSNITQTYIDSNIKYIKSITDNLKEKIILKTGGDIYNSLYKNKMLRVSLEDSLKLFITNRYKYIYVLRKKDTNQFEFLLDGSKNLSDKSEFLESYEPLEIKKFNLVYKTKKSIYFTHTKIESLWVTYLTPIIVNNSVEAVVVVDFSMKDYEVIRDALKGFDEIFQIFILFFILTFSAILFFSKLDFKREREKQKIHEALKEKTKELEKETQKVKEFNLTLEKRVKEEVEKNRAQEKQMLEQSRLAQMGEMISMIAHQWRQPLAAISATSSGLELKAKLGMLDNNVLLEKLKNISNYTQHLSHTIDDFRDFFKSTKELRKTSYTEIVNSVLDIVKVSVENKNIKLLTEFNIDEEFETYPNEIKQVILNLIKNAEDILLEKDVESAYIKIKTFKDNEMFVLEVSDNAGGVPEEIMPKIFDPYFSTKLEKNGTGLGLYMSKTIVEEHCRGRLSVYNSNDGAVFKVELPKSRGGGN